jgi:hypothetical protein
MKELPVWQPKQEEIVPIQWGQALNKYDYDYKNDDERLKHLQQTIWMKNRCWSYGIWNTIIHA